MKIRLFVMLVGVVVSGAAHAIGYTASIDVESSGLSCEERAAQVALLFEAQPGVEKVATVDCVNEFVATSGQGEYSVYTLAIDYVSRRYLSLSWVRYGYDVNGLNPGNSRGAFRTLDECLAARPAEVAAFELTQSLPASFVSCLPDSSDYSEGYVLSIGSLGDLKRRFLANDFSLQLGKDQFLSPEQIAWTEQTLTAEGALVRINDGHKLFFYTETGLPVRLLRVGSYDLGTQCEGQLQSAREIFGHESTQALVGCQLRRSKTALYAMYVGTWMTSSFSLARKYSSYDSCMKFKDVVANRERRDDPRRFLGLVCAPDVFSASGFVHYRFSKF